MDKIKKHVKKVKHYSIRLGRSAYITDFSRIVMTIYLNYGYWRY